MQRPTCASLPIAVGLLACSTASATTAAARRECHDTLQQIPPGVPAGKQMQEAGELLRDSDALRQVSELPDPATCDCSPADVETAGGARKIYALHRTPDNLGFLELWDDNRLPNRLQDKVN